jgi:hypothetical protein
MLLRRLLLFLMLWCALNSARQVNHAVRAIVTRLVNGRAPRKLLLYAGQATMCRGLRLVLFSAGLVALGGHHSASSVLRHSASDYESVHGGARLGRLFPSAPIPPVPRGSSCYGRLGLHLILALTRPLGSQPSFKSAANQILRHLMGFLSQRFLYGR